MGRLILRRGLKPVPPFNRTENHEANYEWYQETYWRGRYTWNVDEQDFPAFTLFDQGYILDAMVEPRQPSRVIIKDPVLRAIRSALRYAAGPARIQEVLLGSNIRLSIPQIEALCDRIRGNRISSPSSDDPSLSFPLDPS